MREMKYIFSAVLFFAFSSLPVCAQTKKSKTEKKTTKPAKKKFVDGVTGFELMYPDSVKPVVLKNNEDVKSQIEPFVIEVYKEQEAPIKKDGKPVYIAMEEIPDACYLYSGMCKSKYKVELKEFLCAEGAAGTVYYSFIYTIEKEHNTIVLKFIHKHCNSCVNEEGEVSVFDKEKDIRWIKDIIESVKFVEHGK
jgi:hypothetical protein